MLEIVIGENVHPVIDISSIPEGIEIPCLKENGACLLNSVLCARQNKDVSIIEGLVFVVPKDKKRYFSGIFKHAWNFKGNVHFDLTADNIWGKEYEKLYYYGLKSKTESEYGIKKVDFDNYVTQGKTEIEKQIQESLNRKDEI